MVLFVLLWSEEVKKNLSKLDHETARRIFYKINWANENHCLFLEKVEGSEDYKYRVGDYRIFFARIEGNQYVVTRLDHRKNAYKK